LPVGAEIAAGLFEHGALASRDVEEQHHGRVARQREPTPLAERVDGAIDVSGAGTCAFGLCPEDPLGEPAEAGNVLGRLDADSHLVAVVGAVDGDPVDGRADEAEKDGVGLCDRAVFRVVHVRSRAFGVHAPNGRLSPRVGRVNRRADASR
jgi:hypothetical protein